MAVNTQPAGETTTSRQAGANLVDVTSPTPAELARIVEMKAASNEWIGRVRLCGDRRWYERIYHGPDYDIWVISWLPGQSTGFHDHGASSGAFIVATGVLEELRPDGHTYLAESGRIRSFGPDYAHDVRNPSDAPAISIHAYSPPLTEMNEYEFDGEQLIRRNGARRSVDAVNQNSRARTQEAEDQVDDSRVEQVLTAARAQLRRMSPDEASEAVTNADAILVDIRPASQRAIEGSIPGALVVERNVLEWRFDPSSTARLPIARSPDLQVIVFCSQGYASSLAAADLQDIGLWRATDIIGGFQAWRAAGLPTEPPGRIREG
jgi:rhodanese-related sulfurtransferase/predicted metal-dependent enzyme (double-stranded beta helix superfamily)